MQAIPHRVGLASLLWRRASVVCDAGDASVTHAQLSSVLCFNGCLCAVLRASESLSAPALGPLPFPRNSRNLPALVYVALSFSHITCLVPLLAGPLSSCTPLSCALAHPAEQSSVKSAALYQQALPLPPQNLQYSWGGLGKSSLRMSLRYRLQLSVRFVSS